MTSPNDIRKRLDAVGRKRRRGQQIVKAATTETESLAREAVAADIEIAEIARRLGVTRQTIYTWTENGEQQS